MIKHSKSLTRKVEAYLKWLTKPQKEYGGHAICPGLAPYRHSVHLLMAQGDLQAQLEHISQLLYPMDIPAVIIYTALPPTDLWEITDTVLNTYEDIEIFINDPAKTGKTNGLYTGFDKGTLIIVQRSDLLNKSREQAKNLGYYSQKPKDN